MSEEENNEQDDVRLNTLLLIIGSFMGLLIGFILGGSVFYKGISMEEKIAVAEKICVEKFGSKEYFLEKKKTVRNFECKSTLFTVKIKDGRTEISANHPNLEVVTSVK